jgi:hypothetical protein
MVISMTKNYKNQRLSRLSNIRLSARWIRPSKPGNLYHINVDKSYNTGILPKKLRPRSFCLN